MLNVLLTFSLQVVLRINESAALQLNPFLLAACAGFRERDKLLYVPPERGVIMETEPIPHGAARQFFISQPELAVYSSSEKNVGLNMYSIHIIPAGGATHSYIMM